MEGLQLLHELSLRIALTHKLISWRLTSQFAALAWTSFHRHYFCLRCVTFWRQWPKWSDR